MAVNNTLYIDVSELQKAADAMRLALSPAGAQRMLHDTIVDTGRRVKTIIGQEVPRAYEVKKSWVRRQVGAPRFGGEGELSAEIPLFGARGVHGGTFHATGGLRSRTGRNPVHVRIVNGRTTTLPPVMSHQGGQPPFRNPRSRRLGNVVFTRKTARPYPIARVAGLSLPQMPMNRSREDVERDIYDYMARRLAHHFDRMLKI